jgi:DNA-binding protein HU-beta
VNKSELVEEVRTHLGSKTSRAQAERVLEAVLSRIEQGLRKDGLVTLLGFGTFMVRKRAARNGRNPRTGEALRIEASRTVRFRAGAKLKGRG